MLEMGILGETDIQNLMQTIQIYLEYWPPTRIHRCAAWLAFMALHVVQHAVVLG